MDPTESDPFRPSIIEPEVEESIVSCWRDGSRPCDNACIAFDNRSVEDRRFNPCMLLNIQRGTQASLSLIARELQRQNDLMSVTSDPKVDANRLADQIKDMDPGPPDIR